MKFKYDHQFRGREKILDSWFVIITNSMQQSFWEANIFVYQKPRCISVHKSTAAVYTYLSKQIKNVSNKLISIHFKILHNLKKNRIL